jgi:hypothetical protein
MIFCISFSSLYLSSDALPEILTFKALCLLDLTGGFESESLRTDLGEEGLVLEGVFWSLLLSGLLPQELPIISSTI